MNYNLLINLLAEQKRKLGMSEAVIAARSGVSQPTVHRILSGEHTGASWINVGQIAHVLGIEIMSKIKPAAEILEEQADKIASVMTGVMLAMNQLEGQGISDDERKRMQAETKFKLLAGPKSKLWLDT